MELFSLGPTVAMVTNKMATIMVKYCKLCAPYPVITVEHTMIILSLSYLGDFVLTTATRYFEYYIILYFILIF